MADRLQGSVAVITEGNSGIGLAPAMLFKAGGARVAILGRDIARLNEALVAFGDDSFGVSGDVTSAPGLNAFFAEIRQRFGLIDVLFCNAGISGLGAISCLRRRELHYRN